MDRELGIEGYATSTPGVGGSVKSSAEDFIVEEISQPPPPAPEGGYTLARVRVRNWETHRLVREFARALRISRRRIGYAGMKDKRAVSTRRFSFEGVPPEALHALRLQDVEILDTSLAHAPLEVGDLLGNRFRIVVRQIALPEDRAGHLVEETARQIRALGGFPNFFGVQRFGSVRPVTHVVGRAIVRGAFAEAVAAYVANPIPGEGEASFRVRDAYARSGDARAALREYPRAFTFEKVLLNHLVTHPDDHVGALRCLPQNLLLMFVHGYQSFLFNRVLSERMRRGIPIHEPVPGDLVLPPDSDGLPDRGRVIEVTQDNVEKVASRCLERKAWVSAILFGSEPVFADGEPGRIEREVVASEGLRPDDFIIPELPRMSSRGTRREVLAPVRDLEARLADGALHLSFSLSRGAYATSLVREFTKPA
jgi:tRNA pseudouridine13 synthase